MAAEVAIAFYQKAEFWSLIVSFGAFLLSVAPHLKRLTRAKLSVEVFQKVHLSHMVGNPNAQLHVILSNGGGRPIRIRGLELRFKRVGEAEFSLSAVNYISEPGSTNSILFTPFSIRGGEEWGHTVNFVADVSQNEQRTYKALLNNLREDIDAKIAAIPGGANAHTPAVIGEPANVQPLYDLFERRFKWVTGDYDITLCVRADDAEPTVAKKLRTTIFESDTKDMDAFKKNYETGRGLWWGGGEPGVILDLSDRT